MFRDSRPVRLSMGLSKHHTGMTETMHMLQPSCYLTYKKASKHMPLSAKSSPAWVIVDIAKPCRYVPDQVAARDRTSAQGKKTMCWCLTKPLLVQELKGNIRVFCRVRPLVVHDALTQSAAVDQLLQFPSSGPATHSAR